MNEPRGPISALRRPKHSSSSSHYSNNANARVTLLPSLVIHKISSLSKLGLIQLTLFIYNLLGLWEPYDFYSNLVRMVVSKLHLFTFFLLEAHLSVKTGSIYIPYFHTSKFVHSPLVTWTYHVFYFCWNLALEICSKGTFTHSVQIYALTTPTHKQQSGQWTTKYSDRKKNLSE